jgi:1,4-alpha-glucan branching enzyme
MVSPCSNVEQYMNALDKAMNSLDRRFSILSSSKQIVSYMNDEEKVMT